MNTPRPLDERRGRGGRADAYAALTREVPHKVPLRISLDMGSQEGELRFLFPAQAR